MTTREHDDLHDARVDSAWRAASREEPPHALDDAIRAAARREIGAGPRSGEARAPGDVPQSLRPERWWWPLAAAATIGVIAIGLLQIVEPERVEPEHSVAPASVKADATDTLATLDKTQKQEAPSVRGASAELREEAAKPDGPAPPASSAKPATPAKPAAKLRKDAAAPSPRQEGARNAATTAERRAASAPAAAPAPAAEPFPAEKLESKEMTKRDAATTPAPAAQGAAPSADSAAANVAPGKLAGAPAPPSESESDREPQRAAPLAAREPAKAQEAQGVMEARATRGPSFAQANDRNAPRAKVAPKLPVPDWISLIRKLRDDGNIDEASKELAAFRKAYTDPDALLPPDLRDWKPTTQ
jgi:hypothetical protein